MFESRTSQEQILSVLRGIKDPDLGRDIVSLGFVKDVKISGESASFTIELTTPACPVREQMKQEAERAVGSLLQCVDEISGQKRLREESIRKDVYPLSIEPVGSYAIRFRWSDGHSTGIYTFEHLRELCPCPSCESKQHPERATVGQER